MASLLDRDWEEALDATLELGVLSVEAMGGGHVPRRHCDPQRLATSEEARHRLTAPVRDRGMELAAHRLLRELPRSGRGRARGRRRRT